MSKAHLIFLLVAASVGCAETQSQRAFIPRPSAEEVTPSLAPNQSREHDGALAEALDRSLREMEDEPMVPARPVAIDKETSATRDLRSSGDTHASKTAGVGP